MKISDLVKKYKGQSIAIIGNGVSSRDGNGTWYDFSQAYEHLWTVNGGWQWHKTSELGFMMDDWASPAHDNDNATREVKEYNLKKTTIPIFTPTKYKEFPCFVEFPLKKVIQRTGSYYFAETISYMVAFAIYCGAKEIHMHGTDYIGCKPSERACTEYWAGKASEWSGKRSKHNIPVYSDPMSHFLKIEINNINTHIPGFYGYIPETFPFAFRENHGGTLFMDINKSRKKEISEFKKTYKKFIQDRLDGKEKSRAKTSGQAKAKKVTGSERAEIERILKEAGTDRETKVS